MRLANFISQGDRYINSAFILLRIKAQCGTATIIGRLITNRRAHLVVLFLRVTCHPEVDWMRLLPQNQVAACAPSLVCFSLIFVLVLNMNVRYLI